MSSASSTGATTSRATQYTVLNASLEKLEKNLAMLEQNVEDTVIQVEWNKRLAYIHSAMLMASSRILIEEEDSGGEEVYQEKA